MRAAAVVWVALLRSTPGNALLWGYVPRGDGKRFLVAELPGANSDAPPPPMTVVVNWIGGVKK